MSAVPAAAADAIDAVPVNRGKKKKLIFGAVALAVLLAAGAGTTVFVIKKRAADAAAAAEAGEGDDSKAEEEASAAKRVKADLKHAPTFVPLDPFTVNLADREAERYAQVGITLELSDAKSADLLKAYMPAIRNNILLALGSKTAAQLIERDGKLRLAAEIRREALRPLGYDIAAPVESASGVPARKPRVADDDDESVPVRAVHFSNFIIQ
ncbi:MAG: flagellar basal body-associated FliL family protein [Pseudomonadota bacterium]